MNNSSKVGYRKPPVETRFQKGKSGNPKGRPCGSRNHRTILSEILEERVSAKKPSNRSPSNQEAIVDRLIEDAIVGKPAAFKIIWLLMQEHDDRPDPPSRERMDPKSAKAIEEWAARLRVIAGRSVAETPNAAPKREEIPVTDTQESLLWGEDDAVLEMTAWEYARPQKG